MTNNTLNNKLIAKNALMLYIRTFITLLVSLYTSRIILEVLGETDFGIYSIIGGVVILFTFIQSSMVSATQRFLNFEMKRGDENSTNKVFSASIVCYILIATIIFILAETIGLWFISTKLNIPEDREFAAFWVYQFSVLTACLSILQAPYNALVIASEKMNFFAYISMIESILKLLIVYLLLLVSSDKLIVYSILICAISLSITLCYRFYCKYYFAISKFKLCRDKSIYKQLLSFSGWTLFGSASDVLNKQGSNIILNIFYGVVVNSAYGIANQVRTSLYLLFSNIQTSANPQITKLYAVQDYENYSRLVYRISKFSFFLLFLFSVPLILNIDTVLNIWIGKPPKYTNIFISLIVILSLIESLVGPIWTSMQATGKIRSFQIITGVILMLNIPLTYLAYNMGYPPYTLYVIQIIIAIAAQTVRLLFARKYAQINLYSYFRNVILPILAVILCTLPIPIILNNYLDGIDGFIITSAVSILCAICATYFIGFSISERSMIKNLIKTKLIK